MKVKYLSKNRMTYWALTAPVLLLMLISSLGYLLQWPEMIEAISQLHYPRYVMMILGIANALGVLAIVYDRAKTLKEWAYAGVIFNLLGASASHAFSGDPFIKISLPLIFVLLTLGSYFNWKKI